MKPDKATQTKIKAFEKTIDKYAEKVPETDKDVFIAVQGVLKGNEMLTIDNIKGDDNLIILALTNMMLQSPGFDELVAKAMQLYCDAKEGETKIVAPKMEIIKP
jgi:hypothetical protein